MIDKSLLRSHVWQRQNNPECTKTLKINAVHDQWQIPEHIF